MHTQVLQQREDSIKQERKRLLALDVARGLAVIGMYIQHFALNEWNSFVSGNTMILFMLCSGMSYSMMVQKMLNHNDRKTLNTRILARSVFIDLVGYLLMMLNGPFAVVLTAYAMLFIMALTLTRCSTRQLFILGSVLFFVSPPLMLIGMSLFENVDLLSDIAGGPLSALAWMPVFITGMALGRLQLSREDNAIKLIIVGILILIPVKYVESAFLPKLYEAYISTLNTSYTPIDPYVAWPYNTQPIQWQMLFLSMPQGGSTCELLAGTGGSLILIGVLCLLEKKSTVFLKPFCIAGQYALTLYVIQIVLGWGIEISHIGIEKINIGTLGAVISVIILSYITQKFKKVSLETAIRCFEQKFY